MKLNMICGHTFIPERINSESIILDLGANRGKFSKGILDTYGCTVVAYEPSLLLCENELTQLSNDYERFSFNQNAVWSERKKMVLADYYDSNKNTSGVANSLLSVNTEIRRDGRFIRDRYEVECLSLDEILEAYEKIDILKIDVEGSEIELLTKTSEEQIKKCNQICVEFHLFCQGDLDITITNEDLEKIKSRLQSLGFDNIKTNQKHPDYLFYNRDK
jgi:FkbM family methyltransferase